MTHLPRFSRHRCVRPEAVIIFSRPEVDIQFCCEACKYAHWLGGVKEKLKRSEGGERTVNCRHTERGSAAIWFQCARDTRVYIILVMLPHQMSLSGQSALSACPKICDELGRPKKNKTSAMLSSKSPVLGMSFDVCQSSSQTFEYADIINSNLPILLALLRL
jgi:hypothetical protein